MKKCCGFCLIVCLVACVDLILITFGQTQLGVQAQPVASARRAGAYTTERLVTSSLEKAQKLLQRADAVRAEVDNCKDRINFATDSLAWVQYDLLERSYHDAILQITSAMNAISRCNDALKARTEESSKDLLHLTKQSLFHIVAAQNALNWLQSDLGNATASSNESLSTAETMQGSNTVDNSVSSTKNFEPGQVAGQGVTCTVDGTTCQFSSCGKGRRLVACAFGFAAGVIGGAEGKSYQVTSSDDDPHNPQQGTLRYGVNMGSKESGGVWITFSRDMTIYLKEMLWVKSFTTIDGRGVNATITGHNLVLGGVHNVILHNIQINTVGDSDTVHIFADSTRIWVDHITSFDAKLGLVSVLQGSTDVTISNSHLSNPNFNMLLGASDADLQDQNMRVTVYRNWFKDSMQRMPHCRWGLCHVINNLYTNWGYYALGARVHGKIVSESNVFIAGRRSEVTPWFAGIGDDFDQTATITSSNDLFLNGATFHEFSTFTEIIPMRNLYAPVMPTSAVATLVQTCSGALFDRRLQHCTHLSPT